MKSFLNTTVFPNKIIFQTKQSDSILSQLITLFQVNTFLDETVFSTLKVLYFLKTFHFCNGVSGVSDIVYEAKRLATEPANTVNIPSKENKKRSSHIITDIIFLFVIFSLPVHLAIYA